METTSNEGVSLYLYYLPINTATAYTNFIRNNGPFYEPGLFASYLNIALVFSLCVNKRLFGRDNIPSFCHIINLFKCRLYIFYTDNFFFLYSCRKKIVYKVITVIAIIFLWQPVMELDFMVDKIASNYG